MGKRRRIWMQRDIQMLRENSTLLDVGAGRGETVNYALSRGLTAFGIEIVPELCNDHILNAPITDIPFDHVETVTCYDVLEHIPPNELEKGLDELFRVAKKQIYCTVSGNEATRGDDTLHLSIHPVEWWVDAFQSRRGHVERVSTYATENDWHFVINLPAWDT